MAVALPPNFTDMSRTNTALWKQARQAWDAAFGNWMDLFAYSSLGEGSTNGWWEDQARRRRLLVQYGFTTDYSVMRHWAVRVVPARREPLYPHDKQHMAEWLTYTLAEFGHMRELELVVAVNHAHPSWLLCDVYEMARKAGFGTPNEGFELPREHPMAHPGARNVEKEDYMTEIETLHAIMVACGTDMDGSEAPETYCAQVGGVENLRKYALQAVKKLREDYDDE